jgi:hypothetical protein
MYVIYRDKIFIVGGKKITHVGNLNFPPLELKKRLRDFPGIN